MPGRPTGRLQAVYLAPATDRSLGRRGQRPMIASPAEHARRRRALGHETSSPDSDTAPSALIDLRQLVATWACVLDGIEWTIPRVQGLVVR